MGPSGPRTSCLCGTGPGPTNCSSSRTSKWRVYSVHVMRIKEMSQVEHSREWVVGPAALRSESLSWAWTPVPHKHLACPPHSSSSSLNSSSANGHNKKPTHRVQAGWEGMWVGKCSAQSQIQSSPRTKTRLLLCSKWQRWGHIMYLQESRQITIKVP